MRTGLIQQVNHNAVRRIIPDGYRPLIEATSAEFLARSIRSLACLLGDGD
jgi:hypothetical protein